MKSDFSPIFIGMDPAGTAPARETAGAKAAELWQMSRLGLAVPPAFVLPSTLCAAVNAGEAAALRALDEGLDAGIAALEQATAKQFGGRAAPLLVSVRSGAAQSMPGMLETILDVGLNPQTLRGLIGQFGNPRLAWDCYRRLLQMYGEVVLAQPKSGFEAALAALRQEEGAETEQALDSEALERLAQQFRSLVPVPNEPRAQLREAALAVYRSWNSPRAEAYRRLTQLEHLNGTAVTVQAMVFGNAGRNSGAGVAFSRNPATGAPEFYVDYLGNAQGEDVVAGARATQGPAALRAQMPEIAAQLEAAAGLLERHYGDMQDIEFTVEQGRLYFLQTRAAKRTPRAALRILVDFVAEALLTPETALAYAEKIDPEQARITRFATPAEPVARATPAAPGVASGRIAFSSAAARKFAEQGDPVILVRHDIATEDVVGLACAAGILTATGGRTAHAAVVARQLGKTCLLGCIALRIGPDGATLTQQPIAEGDYLSLDGDTGEISLGRREIVSELPARELATIAQWRASQPHAA